MIHPMHESQPPTTLSQRLPSSGLSFQPRRLRWPGLVVVGVMGLGLAAAVWSSFHDPHPLDVVMATPRPLDEIVANTPAPVAQPETPAMPVVPMATPRAPATIKPPVVAPRNSPAVAAPPPQRREAPVTNPTATTPPAVVPPEPITPTVQTETPSAPADAPVIAPR